MEQITNEMLQMAISTHKEFIRRYQNNFNEEPVFDLVILVAMQELKERRANERGLEFDELISESKC